MYLIYSKHLFSFEVLAASFRILAEDSEAAVFRTDHGAFDEVLELADISRPGVGSKGGHCF
jgi:hypothetical protein